MTEKSGLGVRVLIALVVLGALAALVFKQSF